MPDRRHRTSFAHPLPERATMLLRERQSSSPGSSSSDPHTDSNSGSPSGHGGTGGADGSGSAGGAGGSGGPPKDDNPFAPPPENRPDQPWRPRRPSHGGEGDGDTPGDGGPSDDRPAWGSQWSSHQPGRQSENFGGLPGGRGGKGGKGGSDGAPTGPRWDPTDPAQRRARYALLSGMWAFFFAIFEFTEIALLLGALGTYWAISSLRAKPKEPSATDPAAPDSPSTAPTAPPEPTSRPAGGPGRGTQPGGARPQATAAITGLVTALLALSIVATAYTVQIVYRDYYTCVNDALTKTGQLSCNDLLPKPLEPLFGVKK
ncbi:hypothetical protein PZB75_20220 [Streptomyces sp. AM 4-1-1]|uniref:hypothetical protein n=1 Tax=Streptomyces sp. AM 4-1-1 TaxID=3028710 RepID=UPI0023BA1D77|nr:hypothetical protein [Streptomyces sp. AM 4-1-1]WEH35480.1 hypothetical protein PZB75_20220 [Streptomyces sp. AM 4-1-1]